MKTAQFAGLIVICMVILVQCGSDEPRGHEAIVVQPEVIVDENAMFTGEEDHFITLEDAEKHIVSFVAKNPEGPFAWTFGRKAVEEILAQEGCVAVRIFGSLDDTGQFSPVLIGVTPDGRSMSSGVVRNIPTPCPPYCDPP